VGQLPVTGPAQGRAGSQHFPTTQATWIVEASRGDDSRLGELAARIIERYAQPLEAYAQGSTLREIAEPRDIVHAFLVAKFASPAATRAYLAAWNASGLSLRRWMMNGLLLHARGIVRDAQRSRERSFDGAERTVASNASTAEDIFERAWAQAILAEACVQVELTLAAEGRDRAWRVFRVHSIDGRAYSELEEEFGLSRQQMADLVRGVTAKLRTRVRELLDEEGRIGDDAVDEIVRLLS
jgi:hypothetical protein